MPDTHLLNRRTLLGRSAAVALLAGLLTQSTPMPARASALVHDQETDLAALVAGDTDFALALYHEVRQGIGDNLLFSPFSISLALAMTYAGARGETADQMASVMSFKTPQTGLGETIGALTADLKQRGNVKGDRRGGGKSGLRIANALWGEKTYPFNPSFSKQIKKDYGADLQLTDFANEPEQARDDINNWVENQTEDRIQDLVPEGAVTEMTKLVLANAIYFFGPWQDPFEPRYTKDDTFHLLDGTEASVPFMSQTEHFQYAKVEEMQLLEMNYANDGFAMTIILPDEGKFDTFEQGLDANVLETVIGQLASTDIRLHLPKFDFDFSAGLAQTLQSMGMTDAFSPDHVDFGGMVEGRPPENLYIGDVLHKAFISVDEGGTEAAAATAVVMPTSATPMPDEPIEVCIDRPFLFAIRDTQTGTMLFLGRVMDPRV